MYKNKTDNFFCLKKADTEQQEDILNPADNLAYTELLGTLIGSEYIYVPEFVATISQTDSQRIYSICRPFRPGKWKFYSFG